MLHVFLAVAGVIFYYSTSHSQESSCTGGEGLISSGGGGGGVFPVSQEFKSFSQTALTWL